MKRQNGAKSILFLSYKVQWLNCVSVTTQMNTQLFDLINAQVGHWMGHDQCIVYTIRNVSEKVTTNMCIWKVSDTPTGSVTKQELWYGRKGERDNLRYVFLICSIYTKNCLRFFSERTYITSTRSYRKRQQAFRCWLFWGWGLISLWNSFLSAITGCICVYVFVGGVQCCFTLKSICYCSYEQNRNSKIISLMINLFVD